MMVDEQIQSYRISWVDKTKPLQSGFVGTMKLSLSTQFRSELIVRVHMNVWHQRRTANHNTDQVWLTSPERASEIQNLFVKRLKNMRNLNTFPLKYLSMQEEEEKTCEVILYSW